MENQDAMQALRASLATFEATQQSVSSVLARAAERPFLQLCKQRGVDPEAMRQAVAADMTGDEAALSASLANDAMAAAQRHARKQSGQAEPKPANPGRRALRRMV